VTVEIELLIARVVESELRVVESRLPPSREVTWTLSREVELMKTE